jgi:hypothetical protein
MRLEGLAGGSCLSPPWRAAGSVKSPASLPQICQVEGDLLGEFPLSGKVLPSDTACYAADNGDDGGVDGAKDGESSDR